MSATTNKTSATLQLTPDKAQYRPGDTVRIGLELLASELPSATADYRWEVSELDRVAAAGVGTLCREPNTNRLTGVIELPNFAAGGAYGVFAEAVPDSACAACGETAFDIAAHWSEAPRYGFLSDFGPESGDGADAADFLLSRHLNVVQYYDWMYRHDRLLTEEEPFVDPLGRMVSLAAVRSRIDALRARGILSFAYAAVYGSLPDYAREHPDQVLYRSDGSPYSLGGYFHIMDISPDSEWTAHIVEQFREAVEWGFDGLHLDQYGFPKRAVRHLKSGAAETVRLADLYPAFIAKVREKLPEAGLIFNNVSTYPVHRTAEAPQDAVYIEVWDPVTRLRDVYDLVRRTRRHTRKQVILAAYLPAFHPEHPAEPEQAECGATVAMASIFASGAYHLLLGEKGGMLADAYYPKHGTASGGFRERLRRYYDFIVMYRDLLFSPELDDWTDAFTGGINAELKFVCDGGDVRFSTDAETGTVWTLAKEKRDAYVIHLINLKGLDNDVWHAPKLRSPEPVTGLRLSVEVVDRIESVFAASPDGSSIRHLPLAYEWERREGEDGRYVRMQLPRVDYWTVVCIRLKAGEPAEIAELPQLKHLAAEASVV